MRGNTCLTPSTTTCPAPRSSTSGVKAEIGDDPPKGQLLHLIVKSDGGLRHLNVWQSKEDWDRHRQERIAPAVAKVLAAAGITERPPAPVEQQLDVVDVWTGA